MKIKEYWYGQVLLKATLVLVILITIFFAVNYVVPMFFKLSVNLFWGLFPFILAVIMAVLIDPVVDWLVEKKNINRGIAVALTLVLLISGFTLIIVFAVSRLIIELSGIYSNLPKYTQVLTQKGMEFFEGIRQYLTNNPLPQEAQDAIFNNLKVVVDGIGDAMKFTTNFVFDLMTALPLLVTIILVAGVATFFISKDKKAITTFIFNAVPQNKVLSVSGVIGDINSALIGFFRAQLILISISTLLAILGLSILGNKYALTVGIVVGIFDLLPILGPGTILVPWAIIEFFAGRINMGIALLVLYGIIVAVRGVIEPKVISQQIGLHPLVTLMALFLGLKFLGIGGIIIGPVAVVLAIAIYKSFYSKSGGTPI